MTTYHAGAAADQTVRYGGSLDAHEKGMRHLICKPFSFSALQRLLQAPAPASAGDSPGLQ